MPSSVYWDACVFIEALQKKDKARLDCCLEMIEKAKKGDIVIVASAFILTEVQRLEDLEKTTGASREQQSKLILGFFENPFISVRSLDRRTSELAHEFIRTHSLAGGDAIHVATAVVNRVDVLYTWDEHKKRNRRGLLGHNGKIGTPPLRIEKPPAPNFGPLFQKPADGVSQDAGSD